MVLFFFVSTLGGDNLTPKNHDALYRPTKTETIAANGEALSTIVQRTADGIANLVQPKQKISLKDLQAVQNAAQRYLDQCVAVGELPTMTGLALSCGVSRAALYKHISQHDDDVSEFLQQFSDSCGEALQAAALQGSVQPVVGIFVLKARHGWRDAITIEAPAQDPLGHTADPTDLAAKYLDNIIVTEEE